MEKAIKHLVQCRCILSQFKNQINPPFHQFIVFSVLDDEDKMKTKFAQCNNCGVIHKVVDICKSDIMAGREQMNSILNIDEIKQNLPSQLVTLLETHQPDLTTWEHAKWIIDNQSWGETLILSSESIEGVRQGKYVRILGEKLYKIDTFTRDEYVNLGAK